MNIYKKCLTIVGVIMLIATGVQQGAQKTVLVVDDSPEIGKKVEKTLTQAKYKVILATDGDDGVQKYNSNKPHLIITSVKMPSTDGVGVTQQQTQVDNKKVPTLILATQENGTLSSALLHKLVNTVHKLIG